MEIATEGQPPQEDKLQKGTGEMTTAKSREPGLLGKAIAAIFGEPEPVDLCDFPLLLKSREDLSTFFRECSAEFPQCREICLPSTMADIVLVSPPPTREALRLLKKLGRGRRVVLSNRLLPEETIQTMTLERILFR